MKKTFAINVSLNDDVVASWETQAVSEKNVRYTRAYHDALMYCGSSNDYIIHIKQVKYVIAFYGKNSDGYTGQNGLVDYNEDTCNSLDNAMTFDDKDEAEKYRAELQEEWLSELRVEEVEV